MSDVQRVCRPQGLTTWVDDIGVDLRGFNSSQVAKHAVSTFLEMRDGLTSRGLEISVKKSSFLELTLPRLITCTSACALNS